jgi:glycosyltransferase involved in cell wall biosynthesis
MTKLLFVGSVIKTEDCIKYIGSSVAGNKMQLGLIKALRNQLNTDISIITEYPIASYPRENVLRIEGGTIKLTDDIVAEKVPFINVFVFKQMTKIINALRLIRIWAKTNKNEEKVIICFNAFPDIALPALIVAKLMRIKNIRTVSLLADLPIDVVKRGLISNVARKVEEFATKICIKRFDGLVVLNKNAITEFAPKSNYIVVDGGFDKDDTPNSPCGGQWNHLSEDEPLRVVFSGAVVKYNGIVNLIEAAKLVKNPRFRLEIYGNGELADYILQNSKVDDRIKYMGTVTNTEMIKIQQEAALLVNPRPVNDSVSRVTFPSKMIEYLLSGTPVVTTKLNGFTEDYLNHMFVFKSETHHDMANTIDCILNADKKELIRKASSAREFILNNKNWDEQTKKVIDFLDDLKMKKVTE